MKVTQIDRKEAFLRYMVQDGHFYSWPALDVLSWQDINDIVCTMPQTLMDNRGHLQFSETSMPEAESEAMKWHVACVHFKWIELS